VRTSHFVFISATARMANATKQFISKQGRDLASEINKN
jgi:hypothetical protein